MTDKQLENSNLEPVVPESTENIEASENTEIPAEELEEVAGGVGPGWNTYREYYGVYCKKCRNIWYAYSGEALQKIVTSPCRWCGAPYTNMIIDPTLSPRNKPDGPLH